MQTPIAPYYRKKMKDGPTLLVKERRGHPIVAVNFWVATGSVNEEPSVNGISHFYEHIFFKGTDKYPRGEMDRQVKSMGGYNNAATSYEFTHYYIVASSWHLRKAMDLLADALLCPSIQEEDVEKERMIIREEIRRRDDNPSARLFTMLQEEMFSGTPYSLPILGKEESLNNIGVKELKQYFKKHYGLKNLIAVVVGDVTIKEVEGLLEEVVLPKAGVEAECDGLRELEIALPKKKKDRFEDKDINQVYAVVAFQTPGMSDSALLPAFEVAAMILGGGKSSRLYQRLLERENLVSSITSWHMELRKTGAFGIDTVFRPGRESEVHRCLFEEIRDLGNREIEDDELARAKVMLRSGFLYENETNAAISGTLGYYEIEFGNAEVALNYLDAIENVSKEDVKRIMNEFVIEQPFSRIVIGPKGKRR
jgi:zinc protease